jgi:hypothetical protein
MPSRFVASNRKHEAAMFRAAGDVRSGLDPCWPRWIKPGAARFKPNLVRGQRDGSVSTLILKQIRHAFEESDRCRDGNTP